MERFLSSTNPAAAAPAQPIERSARLVAEAQDVIPGGVNSPVRAFKAIGDTPHFIERGEWPYLYDVDGNRYIDHVLFWGPLIAGHAHPRIVVAAWLRKDLRKDLIDETKGTS